MQEVPGTVPANGGAEQSDGKCHRKHTAFWEEDRG